MKSENVIVYLTAIVAIGIIVVGGLATFLHSTLLAPIVCLSARIVLFPLLFFVFPVILKKRIIYWNK